MGLGLNFNVWVWGLNFNPNPTELVKRIGNGAYTIFLTHLYGLYAWYRMYEIDT